MKYLIWLVGDTVTGEQIDQLHDEFYSIAVSLSRHTETVVSPSVMARLAEIGYLRDLDWEPISEATALAWIAEHRRTPM